MAVITYMDISEISFTRRPTVAQDPFMSVPSRASAGGSPRLGPLSIRIDLVVVCGDEADDVFSKQAAAMRRVCEWFVDHPASRAGHS
jgi:hypothetical protein